MILNGFEQKQRSWEEGGGGAGLLVCGGGILIARRMTGGISDWEGGLEGPAY